MRGLVVSTLSNGMNMETKVLETLVVENITTVKDEGGVSHLLVQFLIIVGLELVPLGENNKRVRVDNGAFGGLVHGDVGVALEDLLLTDLRVIHMNISVLRTQVLNDLHRTGLASVSGVLLERVAQDGDLLATHSAVHAIQNTCSEALLLELIDSNNGSPVLGHSEELVAFDIGEVS